MAPDFNTISAQMCKSMDGPLTTNVGGYEQRHMFSERHWPTCTCPGYRFSKRTIDFGGRKVKPECIHIIRAQHLVCGWHQLFHETQTERQKEGRICPRCGGPTVVVQVAV